jgi:hypothetical protein
VPVFASEQDVYDHLGVLLEEMCDDPVLGPQWRRADTIVQYRTFDPDSRCTVDLREDSEPCVYRGDDGDLEPELILTMAADTAHRFFLGEVCLTVALARGQIRAEGPVGKILKLVPLVKPFYPRYRALLEAEGRPELVPA